MGYPINPYPHPFKPVFSSFHLSPLLAMEGGHLIIASNHLPITINTTSNIINNSLFPQLVVPKYNFFLHKYLHYSVRNTYTKFQPKIVGCGHTMT